MTTDGATRSQDEELTQEQTDHHVHPLHASRSAIPPSPTDTKGFLAVLKRRDFFYLWVAQCLSQLADKFLMFTLVIVVYDISHKATEQSLLMIAFTFPSVFFSAPAGVYVDRHDKKRIMLATNIIRAALIIPIPLLLLTHSGLTIIPLLVLVFLFSSVGQLYAPAEAASIPSLVSTDEITPATSLFMTTIVLTIVIALALSTIFLAVLGKEFPFFVAAALFIFAGLSITQVGKQLRSIPSGTIEHHNLMKEFKEGLVLIREHIGLRLALGQLSLALMIVFTVFVLTPDYLVRVLQLSANDIFVVLLPATIGMVSTAASIARSKQHRIKRSMSAIFSIVTAGIVILLLGSLQSIASHVDYHGSLVIPVLILAVIFGGALGVLLIPAFAALQEKTTSDVRGRIFGSVFSVINAAIAIPLVLAGILADHFGVSHVLEGVGIVLILIAAAVRFRLNNQMRVLDDDGLDF